MAGRASPPSPLDAFIPEPDVRERFHVAVQAPPALVMDVARDFDMQSVWLIRRIFRLRERLMGATPAEREPRGLLDEMTALGWAVLADEPDKLLICGAACQPWHADVVFEPVSPNDFAGYTEPDRVKIAWTLETEASGASTSVLRHETRVVATDGAARARFRRYWRWARFGIIPIRLLLLPAIRRQAERRAGQARRSPSDG